MEKEWDEIEGVYVHLLKDSGLAYFFVDHPKGESRRKLVKAVVLMCLFIALPIYISIQILYIGQVKEFSVRVFHLGVVLNVALVVLKAGRVLGLGPGPGARGLLAGPRALAAARTATPANRALLLRSARLLSTAAGFYSGLMRLSVGVWLVAPLLPALFLPWREMSGRLPSTLPVRGGLGLYFLDLLCCLISVTFWTSTDLLFLGVVVMLRASARLLRPPLPTRVLVSDHRHLLKTCNLLRDVLSPVLAAQLVDSLTIIGCIIYDLSTVPEGLERGWNLDYLVYYLRGLTYMSMALLGLLLYCWISQETNSANEEVLRGLVESPWYESSPGERRETVLMIQAAQRRVKLTALGLLSIDLRTFIDVLRLSYSYFTVMKQAVEKQ